MGARDRRNRSQLSGYSCSLPDHALTALPGVIQLNSATTLFYLPARVTNRALRYR